MAEWQAVVTPEEFRDWLEFYQRWPFDDLHRFHRPAALVTTSFAGGGEEALRARIEWLSPEGEIAPRRSVMTEADRSLYAAAGMKV